jgi:hypothetical protein
MNYKEKLTIEESKEREVITKCSRWRMVRMLHAWWNKDVAKFSFKKN